MVYEDHAVNIQDHQNHIASETEDAEVASGHIEADQLCSRGSQERDSRIAEADHSLEESPNVSDVKGKRGSNESLTEQDPIERIPTIHGQSHQSIESEVTIVKDLK